MLLFSGQLVTAQQVNSIRILPEDPTPLDTIFIISDLSYQGNCDWGLVYAYTYVVDTNVYVLPTYCGYWDTTACQSIDTFKVDPLPAGNYLLNIEYHQGSICPISDFDATIAELDTSITVSGTNHVVDPGNGLFRIFPNPADEVVSIHAVDPDMKTSVLLIFNSIGQIVLEESFYTNVDLQVSHFQGLYVFLITDRATQQFYLQKVLIH